jgi:hypothetical protein
VETLDCCTPEEDDDNAASMQGGYQETEMRLQRYDGV